MLRTVASRSRGDRSTVRRSGPDCYTAAAYALACPRALNCLRPLPKPI